MEPNQLNKQVSKIELRDMEIKNKLTVTRGEGMWDNGGKEKAQVKEHG